MRLLVDTHVFIWMASQPERLSAAAAAAVVNPDNEVFLSAVSVWEISIKRALGRLSFPLERLDALLAEMGIETLDMTAGHGIAAGDLPRHHDDPFDRALVAQARIEGMTLVSADQAVARYGVPVIA
ncbi:type II toxin-antitoxin system VapC family toxin [Azospirillum sp. 412522]|nr:type II toxin-antitoxin system VapC family toxin [Azospirillum sp. 412522]MBY6262618.1 type II toxin-antitoxin system VapC family toxin [Azospirillum sp. 412522]